MAINKIARENFELWRKTLLAKNAGKMAELYSKDSTFLPTMSPEFKRGMSEAEEYFEHFLKKNPDGKIMEEEIQPLGKNIYLHSGMYNFEVDKNGERDVVQARFTFVWRKEPDGNWKIIHHHSSVKPQ